MDNTPTELEQQLSWITVALVLLNGVLNRLFCELVLQLEGGDGESIDENAEIERQLRLVLAIPELASDTEDVCSKLLNRLGVPGGRATVKQIDVGRTVVDALSQDINNTALCDLTLQPGKELQSLRPILHERKLLDNLRLGCSQEGQELRQVNGVIAIIVGGLPLHVARVIHEGFDDQEIGRATSRGQR